LSKSYAAVAIADRIGPESSGNNLSSIAKKSEFACRAVRDAEGVRRARKSVENFSLDCDIYVTMIMVEMEDIIHAKRV